MKTMHKRIFAFILMASLGTVSGFAQVPTTLHYQGKVTVDGQPFEGTGLFQFSLVDAGTENVLPAKAQALVTNGFLTSVVILDKGNGYADVPKVDFSGGGGSGAEAVASIADGRVVSITVTVAGSGYTSSPSVSIDEPPPATMETLWSPDGQGEGGQAPGSYIPLDVRGGVFSVVLGDASMAPLGAEIFAQEPVFLRVWFDGGQGFEQMHPDFELTAVPYAHLSERAASVADGALTADAFASGAIGNALSAEGIGIWTQSGSGLTATENIGIGTTTPAQALDVSGNIQMSGWMNAAGGNPFEIRMENEPVLRISPAGSPSEPRPNVILGAPSNQITGASTLSATISGGANNVAGANESVVSGGLNNTAGGQLSTVGGGSGNEATGTISTVGGGFNNKATAIRSTVAGGDRNEATGSRATVGGGLENTAGGTASTVPGGADNIASGAYSFAAGRRATAGHSGSFVWSDNSTAVFSSTANNQFLIRAGGGVGIGTNSPAGALHVMGNTIVGGFAEDHRLGVGTDNPWNTLHVVSNADQDPLRIAVGDNNNTAFRIYQNRGTAIGNSWADTAVPERGLRVHGQTLLGDSVGINTTNPFPNSLLHLKRTGTGAPELILEAANARAWDISHNGIAGWLTFRYAANIADGFEAQSFIAPNGSYNRFSDERLKRDVEPVIGFLDRVLSLEPVSYRFLSGGEDAGIEYGFIAQQVQEVFPEMVKEQEELEYLSLSYDTFSVLAIQAIREQQEIIDAQAAEIADLRHEMEERLARIETWMEARDGDNR